MIRTRAARVVVLGAVAVAAAIAAILAASSSHHDAGSAELLVRPMIAITFAAVGLVADERRPHNPTGMLLLGVGAAFIAADLELADNAGLYSIGLVVELVWIGLLVHALALYPTGTFDSAAARAFAAAGWLTTVPLQILEVLFLDPAATGCGDCPENLFVVSPNADAVDVLRVVQGPILGTSTFALGVWAFARRWRAGSTVARRAMWPPLIAGVTALCLIVAAALLDMVSDRASLVFDWLSGTAVLAIPVAIVLGFFRSQMAHARAGDLALQLRDIALRPADLQFAIAEALGDPSLTIAYWSALQQCWVTADGTEIEDLTAADERSVHILENGGERVAALIYDPALDDSGGLVDAVAATAGLALDNERLRAELRAQLVALRASRARIVAAGDAERQRLERNLHDGAQQQLLAIGLGLRHARSCLEPDHVAAGILDEIDAELRDAMAALRELARGLHPAVLTEGGLESAIETIARRAPFPVAIDYRMAAEVPASIEAVAFYVISEALTNSAKHAEPTHSHVGVCSRNGVLVVSVADNGRGGADPNGSGLTGLADRVAAVGGTLSVDAASEGGTRVIAEVPCE